MKEIIRRTLIVFWLISIAVVFIDIYNFGVFDMLAWKSFLFLAVINWTLQYILFGAVNPFVLVRTKSNQKSKI